MKFGLLYLPTFDAAVHQNSATLYQQIFEQVELAEALGFDAVWAAEHHFTPYGGDIPNPAVLLAALAQRTQRMRLGTAGVALPVNRAINVAEQLAMVDALSGGRLDIGVVRAFLNFEYEALQVDMNESRERFNEGVEVLLGAFANERFSYHGKFNHFDNVEMRPRPVQRRPRILVGSVATPESVIYAGHQGFDLMVIPYAVSMDIVAQTIALYHQSLREAGHRVEDHGVVATFHLYLEADAASACATVRDPILRYVAHLRDAVAADRWSKDYRGYEGMAQRIEALMDFDLLYDGRTVFGDPAHAKACLQPAIDAGVTEVNFVTILPGLPQDKILASLRLFAAEVMPHFR
jgi:natural product biosynthesis luciferase-like monooxygenase protein